MKIAGTSLEPLEFWRDDVSTDETLRFLGSIGATALRFGSGGIVGEVGSRPAQTLILYEKEWCPYSRLVREALSELDLDALIKPCPDGETLHRAELRALCGEEQVPTLVDRSTDMQITESRRILEYLFSRYGSARPLPLPLRSKRLALMSSRLASRVAGGELPFIRPSCLPEQPLEIWSYEASPWSRFVRQRLGQLGLAHVSHNLARRSPPPAEFRKRYGRVQFPFLLDPNAGVSLFESDAICDYIDRTYGPDATVYDAVAQPRLA
jgi:glutathione S-transferase